MSEADKNLLISVPIDLLYNGMVVQDDIYDSTGDRLLVTSGNTLNVVQLERIKRLNSGGSNIFVTGRTHETMLSKRPNIDFERRTEVEESTGYTKIKDETFELLEEISAKRTISVKSLTVFSDVLTEQIESNPPTILMFLINAMAPVDEYLQRHCVNVGMLNGLIGRWMGLPKTEVDKLVMIGLVHDCGKILLPTKVLNAPRRLTTVEYEVVKKHVVHTYDLLSEFPEDIRLAASSHHERLNGKGYTKNLSGDDIPLGARITAISDTYDAMVAQRAYQGPQSPFTTLAHMEELGTSELDGDIINVLIDNMPETLLNEPVMMSDGTIGIVRDYDPGDIGYPTVELSGREIKTGVNLYCVHMFSDE